MSNLVSTKIRRRDNGNTIDYIASSGNQVAIAQGHDVLFYQLDENNKLNKLGFAHRLKDKVNTIDFSAEDK